MSDVDAAALEAYRAALVEYVRSHTEASLYRASQLSRTFVEQGVGPEEIIALHVEAIERVTAGHSYREQARATTDGLQFLLEMMIAYGVQYQVYMALRLEELRRQTEAQAVLQRQRLELAEQSEREKIEILATVAHELGTPITAAKGYVDYARRLLSAGKVDAALDALGTAREAVERLIEITGDLVRASGDEIGALDRSPVDLRGIVQQSHSWARAAAEEKDVALSYDGGTDGAATIQGSADALLTILGNLLSNAIRYTPAGGRVVIRQGRNEQTAWVSVADTGMGMAAETQSRIFERFYRAPEARGMVASGLGLGLALTQQLVRAHGGEITVESRLGEGSTFTVAFPVDGLEVEKGGSSGPAE